MPHPASPRKSDLCRPQREPSLYRDRNRVAAHRLRQYGTRTTS